MKKWILWAGTEASRIPSFVVVLVVIIIIIIVGPFYFSILGQQLWSELSTRALHWPRRFSRCNFGQKKRLKYFLFPSLLPSSLLLRWSRFRTLCHALSDIKPCKTVRWVLLTSAMSHVSRDIVVNMESIVCALWGTVTKAQVKSSRDQCDSADKKWDVSATQTAVVVGLCVWVTLDVGFYYFLICSIVCPLSPTSLAQTTGEILAWLVFKILTYFWFDRSRRQGGKWGILSVTHYQC